MYSVFLDQLRESLNEKHAHITNWLEDATDNEKKVLLGEASEEDVQAHLDVIENSLEKVDTQEFGVCEICHESVDAELLEMDYTATVCLGHFTPEEIDKLETELELAQTVQKSLLPQQLPQSPGLEISAFSRPAQVIGGDYFDFFQFQDGAQGIAIADVAGHGVSAALHMASIQALLRTMIPISKSPLEVVKHVQRLLIHNIHFSNFVTMFLGSYDAATRRLHYCNAGHNPPLRLHREGDGKIVLEWLWPTGAAVGLVEQLVMKEAEIRLEPGDFLVMYTDGVTEAMDAHAEEFGYDRLAQAAASLMNGSTGGLVQGLRQSLLNFTGQANLADDTTILVCKIAN